MLLNFEHLKTFYSALQQKIKSFRGNWEQNDPTADDYIKNRTHYSEGIQEVTVLQYEVDTDAGAAAPMVSAGPTVYYIDFDPTGLQPFVVGQQYSVKWANASYTCVAKMHEGLPVPVLGDVGLFNGYEDTGEPFLIGFDAQEGFGTFITTKAGKYTVTVTTHQEIVHKLDKKFIDLPENLVTSDNIAEVLPDNLITSEELAEALPENLVTSDELATVATSGDYKDLLNTPTNIVRCDSDLSFGRLFNRQDGWAPSNSYASCEAFDEVVIDVYNSSSTYRGSAVTNDGINWEFRVYYSDQAPNGRLTSSFNEMDSGGIANYFRSIGVGGEYIGYYERETGWKIEKFPITQNNSYLGWNHICFGNNKIVVICGPEHKYTNTEQVSSVAACCTNYNVSTDTYTWIETTMPEAAQWSKVAFGQLPSKEIYAAIAYGTTAAYSNNGADWTKTELPVDATWTWLVWNDNKNRFVAVSLEGDAAYSDDGITWTLIEGEIKPYAGPIVFYDDKLVSLSSNTAERYPRYSSDGITWSEGNMPLPFSYNRPIVLLQKVFNNCLMAIDSSGQYVVSNDGIIWNNTVLMADKVLENENLANTLAPYIMADSNIPDTIARVTDVEAIVDRVATLEEIDHDAYIAADTVILETATQDAANKSAVVLAESQKYTDDKVTEVRTTLSDETETLINEKLDSLGAMAAKDIVEKADLAEDVQTSLNKADTAVSYEAQTLTEEQKTQARKNLDMYYTEDGGMIEILPSSSAIDTGNAMMGELYVIGSPITLEVGKTYKVIYNGIEYESVAAEFTLPQVGLSVGLGDIDAVTTGAPSGAYPFVLAVNDLLVQMGACAAIIPLDGSTNITVSILGKNEIIHYISPKYIKDMYYTEEGIEKYIFPETIVPSNTQLPLEQPFDIKANETYICTVDGIEYECTAIEIGTALGVSFSVTLLGNTKELTGTDTGEPFYFVTSTSEIETGVYGMAMIEGVNATATVSIKQVKEKIYKLDNKYLDLDWIPKIKYAKGNSFYSNDNLSLSSTSLDGGVEIGQQMIFDNDFSTITIDDILFISFDEEVYECKASLFTLPDATVLCFGNQSIMGIGVDTGEPFIIMFTESLGIVCTHSDKIGSTHSLEVFTAVNGNPIPTEFLPSDLTATYDMGIDFNHYIGRPFADISTQMNDAYNAYLRGSAVFAKYQSSTGLVLSIFNDTIDAGLNSYLCLATEKGLFCFNGQGSIKVQSITYADLSNLGTLAKKSTVEKTDLATNVQSSLDKADSAILYEAQTLTEEQKAQARANIGVGTGGSNFSGSYNDLTDKPTINGKTLNQNIVLTSTDVNGVEGRQYGTTNPETGEIEIIVAQAGAEVFNDSINNRAIGECSHAEGKYTKASGNHSHAEGSVTEASGDSSHAEGSSTKASGNDSHAEGWGTKAYGECSHAEGGNTIASGFYSHVQGLYNIEDTENKYIHIVGNGNAQARSNAHTLDWDGNAWYAGNVECTGVIIKSSTVGSTKKFKLTIDDSGVITATEVV